MKWQLTATAVTCVSLLASDAGAVGRVPITPFFGLQFLLTGFLAGSVGGLWFARRAAARPFLTGSAVLLATNAAVLAVMVAYAFLWTGLFSRVPPILSNSDVWAVFWWDPLVLVASVVALAAVQRWVVLLVGHDGADGATWSTVLRSSLLTHACALLMFLLAAGVRVVDG